MTEQDSEIDVDLTSDEPQVDPDDAADLGEPEPEEEPDPVEEGKEEAKRVLNAQEQDTEYGRAEAAIKAKQQSLQSMSQQYQAAEQNVQSLGQRLEGIEHTIDRLEEASEHELVLQSLEGGVVMEVPPEDRDDVLEDVQETRDEIEEQREELSGQLDAIKRGVEKNQAAIQYLQNYRDMVEE